MTRGAARLLTAIAASAWLVAVSVAPVLAECVFVPPWPAITTAIPSARVIVIGDVVADFDPAELELEPDQAPRDYALRVTEVLRGAAQVGDLIDVQYLLPNWPWTNVAEGDATFASCTYLQTSPGEVIALAFDALHPGGLTSDSMGEWVQPPTRYNAVGVIEPGPFADNWLERETVTIEQLRELAAMPRTDTDQSDGDESAAGTSSRTIVVLVAVLIALMLVMRQTRPARAG